MYTYLSSNRAFAEAGSCHGNDVGSTGKEGWLAGWLRQACIDVISGWLADRCLIGIGVT